MVRYNVSKRVHAINRRIVALEAIKNHQDPVEAEKEYTRKILRENRARKLREEREYREKKSNYKE
jgi:hypothetical protein